MLTQYLSRKILIANRLLLVFLAANFFSVTSAQTTFLGISAKKPEVGYYSLVLTRFYEWYKSNFFDFDKKMKSSEKQLIQAVIDEVNQSREYLDSETEIPKFRLMISANSDALDYSNIFVALNAKNTSIFNFAKAVIKDNELRIPNQRSLNSLVGMQWSIQKETISLFFQLPVDSTDLKSNNDHEFLQVVFSNKKVQSEIYWGSSEGPTLGSEFFIDGVTEARKVTVKDRKMSYIASTLLPTRLFSEKLKDPLRKITKEFGFGPQAALIEDETKVLIYY